MAKDDNATVDQGPVRLSDTPNPKEWSVELRLDNLTIIVTDPDRPGYEYEIDCEAFSCPSECLHWFAHFASKTWGTSRVLHQVWAHMKTVWKLTHGTEYPQRIWPSKYKAFLAKQETPTEEPQ